MTALLSYSSRPINVDLPSSTEPAVAILRSVAISCAFSSSRKHSSEIPLALAIFHARFGDAVVGAGGAAFGQPRHRGLGDHLGHRAGQRFDAAGARDVADGAEPHHLFDDFFVLARLQVL